MPGTEGIVRHVLVRGRVQGVGFRAFIEEAARERGLQGWVRNRRDGAVEAVFAGPAAIVAEMINACRSGPRGARVDGVEVAQADQDLLGDQQAEFAVVPTA